MDELPVKSAENAKWLYRNLLTSAVAMGVLLLGVAALLLWGLPREWPNTPYSEVQAPSELITLVCVLVGGPVLAGSLAAVWQWGQVFRDRFWTWRFAGWGVVSIIVPALVAATVVLETVRHEEMFHLSRSTAPPSRVLDVMDGAESVAVKCRAANEVLDVTQETLYGAMLWAHVTRRGYEVGCFDEERVRVILATVHDNAEAVERIVLPRSASGAQIRALLLAEITNDNFVCVHKKTTVEGVPFSDARKECVARDEVVPDV
jgi:hypothetical protein